MPNTKLFGRIIAGLAVLGADIPVLGIGVRAPKEKQEANVLKLARETAALLGRPDAHGRLSWKSRALIPISAREATRSSAPRRWSPPRWAIRRAIRRAAHRVPDGPPRGRAYRTRCC